MTLLKDQAIHTALLGNWDEAISINLQLLKENPDDVDTLNRLGFAFAAIGKTKDAKHTYLKVLKLDLYNPIASRNLKRLAESKENGVSNGTPKAATIVRGSTFLEETGKTKVVELVNVAEPKIISQLQTGSPLELCVKRLKVFVLDRNKQYVGMLPDNIGKRLVDFITGGNTYDVYVRSVKNHSLCVFIKEIVRAKRFKNQPSFIAIYNQTTKLSGGGRKTKDKFSKLVEDAEENYSTPSGFGELDEETF